MNLKEELGAFALQMSKNAPVDTLQTMSAEIGKLVESGLTENALKVGDNAPEFELKNYENTEWTDNVKESMQQETQCVHLYTGINNYNVLL